jgi:hypothetical protein
LLLQVLQLLLLLFGFHLLLLLFVESSPEEGGSLQEVGKVGVELLVVELLGTL